MGEISRILTRRLKLKPHPWRSWRMKWKIILVSTNPVSFFFSEEFFDEKKTIFMSKFSRSYHYLLWTAHHSTTSTRSPSVRLSEAIREMCILVSSSWWCKFPQRSRSKFCLFQIRVLWRNTNSIFRKPLNTFDTTRTEDAPQATGKKFYQWSKVFWSGAGESIQNYVAPIYKARISAVHLSASWGVLIPKLSENMKLLSKWY